MKVVVFVDVQNDFVTGSFGNEAAQKTVPKIVDFAKECVKNGYKLYATRDTHEKTTFPTYEEACKRLTFYGNAPENELIDAVCHTPKTGYLSTLEGQKLPIEHCIEGTDGWQIVPELMDVLLGNCTFVNKPTFGSFDLAKLIEEDTCKTWEKVPYEKNYDIDEIVICGFCTDICVISNAIILRAKFPNVKITIKQDLCAGAGPESHNAALMTAGMCQIDVE